MKKFLSLVLALVMTMSLVTVSAGAKDFTDSSKIQYTEAVDVMSAVKVIDGYAEGDFRPSTTLTRGAAAKIICNLILGPTTASALVADAAPYKDVPTNHTFAGYIAYCQKTGIISGYADGTFKPANSLTGYAFMKMLLGALGYDSAKEGYTGPNWSIQVAKRALNIGLDDDLVGDFNGVKAVNREEACLYSLNTLTATMVEYEKNSTVTVGNITIKDQSSAKDMVNTGKTDGKIFKADGKMQFAEKYFDNLSVTKGSDDFARPANVWKLKAEKIGTYADTADLTYTKSVDVCDIYKDLGLGSKIEKKDVSVYVDGVVDPENKIVPVAITKDNDDDSYGANGVLTEVFYDDDADTVTITEVNTYVGEISKTVKATSKKDAYVKGGMTKVMFIYADDSSIISDSNKKMVFLANESVSNLIHTKNSDYYTFNAVINGEIKEVMVDWNVEVNGKTLASADVKSLNGLFESYSVDKYGVITRLTSYSTDAYNNTDAKQVFNNTPKIEGVDSSNNTVTAVAAKSTIGIDKKSADYTVLVKYDDTTKDFKHTITVDDNAKVYAVDEDGNITESSYKAITKDTNDKVYAVIEDYLVKALVIEDVDDGKAPEVTEGNGTFDVTVSKNQAGALGLSYSNYVVEGYPNFSTDWEGTKGKVTVTLVVDGETFTQTTSYKGTQTVQYMLDNAKIPSITLDLASGGVKVKATVTVTFDGMNNDTYKLVGTSGLSILG